MIHLNSTFQHQSGDKECAHQFLERNKGVLSLEHRCCVATFLKHNKSELSGLEYKLSTRQRSRDQEKIPTTAINRKSKIKNFGITL